MKTLWVLLIFLFGLSARADLLERFHIESALQERLQELLKIYDTSAKVLVHVDYQNYEGALPGTNVGDNAKVLPDHVESVDIVKVSVDIYTTLDGFSDEAKAAMKSALPVKDKKKIDLKIHKYDAAHINSTTKPVEVKDLADIVHNTVITLAMWCGVFIGGGFFLLLGFLFWQNSRRTRDLKDQMKLLVAAIGDSGGGGRPVTIPARANAGMSEYKSAAANSEDRPFENWSTKSLRELMADAYWCELDGYANWLWREFSSAQKYELLNDLPFLKDYSSYFVDGPVTPQNYHEHPYYLEPQALAALSQEHLGDILKTDIGFWHIISPMRRRNLPLSLQEKMTAEQAPRSKSVKIPSHKSPVRTLRVKPSWGDLSMSDEKILYEQPDMVPIEMRKHIRSLVWLAQKNSDRVRQVLAKYDARSLASAWVGPEDVLKTLESGLPEKKLKLLQAYRSKTEASRDSEIYQILVDEGLTDEAA